MDGCAAGSVNVLYTAVTRGMNVKKNKIKKNTTYLEKSKLFYKYLSFMNYFFELSPTLKEKLIYCKTKPNSITAEKENHNVHLR